MNYATKYRALIFKQTQHRPALGYGTSVCLTLAKAGALD